MFEVFERFEVHWLQIYENIYMNADERDGQQNCHFHFKMMITDQSTLNDEYIYSTALELNLVSAFISHFLECYVCESMAF